MLVFATYKKQENDAPFSSVMETGEIIKENPNLVIVFCRIFRSGLEEIRFVLSGHREKKKVLQFHVTALVHAMWTA